MPGINLITKYRKYRRQRWHAIILKSFSHILYFFHIHLLQVIQKLKLQAPMQQNVPVFNPIWLKPQKGLVQFNFLHIFVLASSRDENSIQICGIYPNMEVTKWKILIILLMTCLSGYLYITYFDMIIQPQVQFSIFLKYVWQKNQDFISKGLHLY